MARPNNEAYCSGRVKCGRCEFKMEEGVEEIELLIFADAFLLSRD